MEDIINIVKWFKNSGLLIKAISESNKNVAKNKK